MSTTPKKSNGYSLIELIVVVSLSAIVVGAGLAGFNTFGKRQQLVQSADALRGLFESARLRSSAGDLGNSNCARLDAYRVRGVFGNPVITLSVQCRDSSENPQEYTVQRVTLPSGVTIGAGFDLRYKALGHGVESGTTITLNSTIGQSYSFEISDGGAIGEGELN